MSPSTENARPRTPPAAQQMDSSATAGTTTATASSDATARKSKPGVMPLSPKTPEKVRRIVSTPELSTIYGGSLFMQK